MLLHSRCLCIYSVLVLIYAGQCVWAHIFLCSCICAPTSISMEIKRDGGLKFTHSPCFDSIQSTVCIITLVLYGNLLGPKYCSLTNPSFVFCLYTKHQSCFSTHAAHQPPLCLFTGARTRAHTHTDTHTPPHRPRPSLLPRNTEQYGTESWLIRTARHAGIWVCH